MDLLIINGLTQPLLSNNPEFGHEPKDVLRFSEFLKLLKLEEDYFGGDATNTKMMITRLRKIFYDKWGWNTQLIRKAALVEGRYNVDIIDCQTSESNVRHIKKIKRYTNNTYTPKCRLVTYKNDDKVFGDTRFGRVPEIYINDHADVLLPEGLHCDLAHVLAGLDALNHPQVVSPLPEFLFFIHRCFPYATSNADVATWLGDIATSAADFVFKFLKNECQPLDLETEQHYININASASDMLGNIDAFVIHHFYNVKAKRGKRVSEIFDEYYSDDPIGNTYRSQRFEIFSQSVGLGKWDPLKHKFSKEEFWMQHYSEQLRNTIAFMIYSLTTETATRIALPLKVWRKKYEHVVKVNTLLEIFLLALKKLM